jgi:hypothetical protein
MKSKSLLPLFPLIAIGASLPAGATILTNHPSITGGSTAFGQSPGIYNAGTYAASEVFDRDIGEYASANQGINTFLNFNFGASTSFDTIVVVNRGSAAATDLIGNYTLTLSSGTSTITRTAATGKGGFDSLGGLVTTTTVSLGVDTLGGGGTQTTGNTGAMEIYFLKTPDSMTLIPGVSVTTSSAAFSVNYAATQAINSSIGRDNNTEFASTAGVNTFVDFDLGSMQTVGGFDFFDRMALGAQVSSFNLIFSEDSTFGNGDDITKVYTGSTQSAEFAGIDAQYVRYDVTNVGTSTNVGMNEIRFYAVPEPAAALLGSLGMLALLRRRRA